MRERINRLANGVTDVRIPQVSLKPDKFDGTVKTGEIGKTELFVNSENGIFLKGLAYTDRFPVRVADPSFGGVRNRIILEVDARHLEDGDEISGTVNLVTNGGDYNVPFLFRAVSGTAGRTLSSLKTAGDFSLIAGKDRESALRLFDYKDFVYAPFMNDLRIRTLYNSFSGGANRESAMEEFLVASGAKEPASVKIEDSGYTFSVVKDILSGSISMTLLKPGWFNFFVRNEGEFIQLPKRSVQDRDFKNGHYDFQFSVDPSKLHPGLNSGAILFLTEADVISVPISAHGAESSENNEEVKSHLTREMHFANYAEYRVRYALEEDLMLPDSMIEELDAAAGEGTPSHFLVLLKAEAFFLKGKIQECQDLIHSVSSAVEAKRQTEDYEYLLLEYLNARMPGQESCKAKTVQLLRKALTEQHRHQAFPLLVNLDFSLKSNPAALMETIRFEFLSGNRSPFLYAEYLRTLALFPEFLHELGKLELYALWFGVRRDIISENIANVIAHHAGNARIKSRLIYPLLNKLYQKYPSAELLTAVCSILIRNDIRAEEVHVWFEKGMEQNVRLTGLYEYLLYTLPSGYRRCLPKEVLSYFLHDNLLDSFSKERLYENILLYLKPEAKLWGEYKKQIEDFTLERIRAGRIDPHLAVIYKKVLRPDMITEENAGMFPPLLNSWEIHCRSGYMKSVVVIYPELKDVSVFQLEKEKACVPVYADDAVLLFQNAYGNRYYNIPYEKQKLCDMPEIMDRCSVVCPEHLMMRLKKIREIMGKKEKTAGERNILEQAAKELPLSELYRKKMLSVLVSDSMVQPDFLIRADKGMLSRPERKEVCSAMIRMGRCREAYEIIKTYGCMDLDRGDLLELCTKMILDNLFTEDRLLLYLAVRIFDSGGKESVILDYLCEHFNGSTDEMMNILTRAIGARTETYDMEERLLAQMLFTGNDTYMDQVFTWYVNRKKASENIVRAYVTVKCEGYFIDDRIPDHDVFLYLEKALQSSFEKERIPSIYRLALSKYYASLPGLTDEQKDLADDILNSLLDEKLVFPYYKSLARFICVPGDILDRAMIEYHSRGTFRPEIKARILPDEKDFQTEAMKRMFPGVFVSQKVLFAGETWEYEIYDRKMNEKKEIPDTPVLADGGSIQSVDSAGREKDSRFGCLNDLSLKIRGGSDENSLKAEMEKFVMQEEKAVELFKLI